MIKERGLILRTDSDRLHDTWLQVENLSDSVCNGLVSITDLEMVLREEYQIFRKEKFT